MLWNNDFSRYIQHFNIYPNVLTQPKLITIAQTPAIPQITLRLASLCVRSTSEILISVFLFFFFFYYLINSRFISHLKKHPQYSSLIKNGACIHEPHYSGVCLCMQTSPCISAIMIIGNMSSIMENPQLKTDVHLCNQTGSEH